MYDRIDTVIPDCFELKADIKHDRRGRFVKVMHKEELARYGVKAEFVEEYYTVSMKGVVRGMHFQRPPMDHEKLVYCVYGDVLDVVVDLRLGSPTYGKFLSLTLSADNGNMLYVPKGLAHGFCALSETAIMMYKVSSYYSPKHDDGVLWSSVGCDWPVKNPVLSDRDMGFVELKHFDSPFYYENT